MRYRRRHPNATLTIVGASGPSQPGVVYLTGVTDAQLAELYRRSWVFASPSSYEGFGLPYLEAMACGTPVVATANPGSIEVLADGAYGLMPRDDDFAATVSDLLGDEARRAALTDAGFRRGRFVFARPNARRLRADPPRTLGSPCTYTVASA